MAASIAQERASGFLGGIRRFGRSVRHPKTAYMVMFGFSSALPYALLLGTLYAWLSDAQVDLETMGVFSLIGLTYAFKFLWSPLIDRISLPVLRRLGRRKQWILLAQFLLGGIMILLSTLDPASAIGLFSLLAGMGAFASATQDVVVDAWRVDVADETATLDTLSTVYQLGYRAAVLVGGALALFLADAWGWPPVYALMGFVLIGLGVATLFAPEGERAEAATESVDALRQPGELNPKVRTAALAAVGILWLWALGNVLQFMIRSLGSDPANRPDSVAFISVQGPVIVIATVVVPSIIAAWLAAMQKRGRHVLSEAAPRSGWSDALVDHGYRALILPLTEIMGRLGWAAVLVLALVLSYRITDTIWGTFAYPFYLDELAYTKSEVAVASKFFGVGALMLGVALGGMLFAVIGRMAVMTLGALTAALTNLLYADLALGGTVMSAVSRFTGFTWLVEHLGGDERLARLMVAIGGENLAGGLAGAALVAYLSSITSKGYSAVQYALLSSLTFLVGTLGRGALGKMIETEGYYPVFLFTTALGFVAVALCVLEWIRQGRTAKAG
ncbi:MAG: MFS transporter [Sphingobium sp.]